MTEGTAVALAEPAAAPAVAEAPGTLLAAIVGMAKDPAVDVAKLSALLAMQERLEARDAKAQFNRAYIRLQPRLPVIKKDGRLTYPVDKKNPDGPQREISKYGKWESIHEEIMPLLAEEGFGLAFTTAARSGDGGGLTVIAILKHGGGHETETPFPVPLDTSGGKNNIQGMGSALSYGKRYATIAALNIRFEGADDDGKLGGMRFITAEQVAELRRYLDATKSDEAAFLQHFEVASIENLQEANYAPARNMLTSKLERQSRTKRGDQ